MTREAVMAVADSGDIFPLFSGLFPVRPTLEGLQQHVPASKSSGSLVSGPETRILRTKVFQRQTLFPAVAVASGVLGSFRRSLKRRTRTVQRSEASPAFLRSVSFESVFLQ